MPAANGIGAGGVKLDRCKAHVHIARGSLRRHVGVDPEFRGILTRLGVKVGIAADLLVDLTAEQRPDWTVARLAQDVPAGDFKACEGAHDGGIGALSEATGVNPAIHQFDLFGAGAHHVAFEHIFDHRTHRLWPHGRGVALAIADDAIVGGDLGKDPIAPTPARRGWGDDENLKITQLHGALLSFGRQVALLRRFLAQGCDKDYHGSDHQHGGEKEGRAGQENAAGGGE